MMDAPKKLQLTLAKRAVTQATLDRLRRGDNPRRVAQVERELAGLDAAIAELEQIVDPPDAADRHLPHRADTDD